MPEGGGREGGKRGLDAVVILCLLGLYNFLSREESLNAFVSGQGKVEREGLAPFTNATMMCKKKHNFTAETGVQIESSCQTTVRDLNLVLRTLLGHRQAQT